jgi:hypothetical protein
MRCAVGRLILILLSFSVVACGFSTKPAPDDIATQVAEAVDATLTASAPRAATATEPSAATLAGSPTPGAQPSGTGGQTAMAPAPPASVSTPQATTPTATITPPQAPTPARTLEAEAPCPPPGNPPAPPRPAFIEEYPAALAAYLSEGAGATEVESLLREWEAVTHDSGSVESLDMTGDRDDELVVFLVDPSPKAGVIQWPPGEVLIFQCEAGKVVPAFLGRSADDEDWDWFTFQRQKLEDVNDNGLADLVYVGRTCGAHTCFDRLYVIEWDGAAFVNRALSMEAYPYPTFMVGQGQIHVDVGGIGSAGAGIQRSVQEVWTWDGVQYAFSEETVGPPLTLIQYTHDGDDALARGSYAEAIEHYLLALDTVDMDSGLFLGSEEDGLAVIQAYTLFKLVVSHAAAGDVASAETYFDRLLAGHLGGTLGHVYVRLAEAFWNDFMANGDAVRACQEAVAVAEVEPLSTGLLYAGYANPEYTPARLCGMLDPVATR